MFTGSNEYKQRRYDKGFCVNCSVKRDSEKALCVDCRNAQKITAQKRHEQRKIENKCTGCGHKISGQRAGQKCLRCWFSHVAVVSLGTRDKGEGIARLFFEQRGQCAYTNEKLIPAKNACLDHKIPRTKGGSNDLDNIHWVTKDINRVKGNKTHDEFLALCRNITAKYDN